jgi:hypothetical protein
MRLTPPEQINKLTQSSNILTKRWFNIGVGAFVLLLAAAAIITKHPVFIMLSLFSIVVAAGSRRSTQNLKNAAFSIKHGKNMESTAMISIKAPIDDDRFYATIDCQDKVWKFEFIPQGWKPQEGKVSVTVYYLEGIDWPTLLVGQEGIMVPRYNPEIQENN